MSNEIEIHHNPKVLVIGLEGSGKSTFCESITEVIMLGDTEHGMQFDFARFAINDSNYLYVFGFPNLFSFILTSEIYSEGLLGFIVMLDSGDSEKFREVNKLIEILLSATSNIHCFIVANKQDLEGAWSVEDLRIILRIPPETPIVPCVATDKKSVANVLIELCQENLKETNHEEPVIDTVQLLAFEKRNRKHRVEPTNWRFK